MVMGGGGMWRRFMDKFDSRLRANWIKMSWSSPDRLQRPPHYHVVSISCAFFSPAHLTHFPMPRFEDGCNADPVTLP